MPLINRAGGGGGTPQLCEQVDNFTVTAGMLTATLTWTAPTTDEDDSFVGTRIVRKVGSAPQSKSDGTVIYEGTALTYTDTGLTEGTTYYYRAFAYNAKNKYQTAMRVVSLVAQSADPDFNNNSWDTIIAVCQSGSVPSTWSVGDSKTMTIDGVEHKIDIIGKNHDTYADGGTAPLTFQLHRCLDTRHTWVTNYDSNISIMPLNVQNAIRNVVKPTAGVDVSMKLFLLSEDEVIGTHIYAQVSEGTQYEYYSAGNSAEKIAKSLSSSSYVPVDWHLRSRSGSSCARIKSDGSLGGGTDTALGISFGFCF